MHSLLLIDDLRTIYLKMRTILPEPCFHIDYAKDGKEGLEKLEHNRYDLVLLDIHMPGMNGIEVCRKIKEKAHFKALPVIFLTSDVDSLVSCFDAGAVDYILKPFTEGEVVARVKTRLKWYHEHRNLVIEKSKLERDLNKRESLLNEVKQDMDRYFYQTSHKFRAPINSLMGLFQLVEVEMPEFSESTYYQLIKDSCEQMKYINEQISQIGQLKDCIPQYKWVPLQSFMKELLLEEPFSNEKIQIDIPATCKVLTDPGVLRTGVRPLLRNAVYYSRLKSSDYETIVISCKENNGDLVLSISDRGTGISEESRKHIFQLFYQGDCKSKGNGLGLYITRMALIQLDLDFQLNSRPGHFTEVSVSFSNSHYVNYVENEREHHGG